MKQSVKRALDTLEALGFHHEPHPYKAATSIHWHANEPDTKLKVWAGMTDAAAKSVVKHAEAIVGLASSVSPEDPARKPSSIAQRRETAERMKQIAVTKRIAERKEEEARESRARQFLARQNKGTLTTADRLVILANIRQEWIEPTRIADELCIPLRDVMAAINETFDLEAHVHPGKRVLCRVADVRRWISGRAA